MSFETTVIKREDFIEKADNDEFVTVVLKFEDCIKVEIKGDNLNNAVADFFRYRQKKVPRFVEFKEFVKGVKYLLGRGCKITNLEVKYKGTPLCRLQTWARQYSLKKLKEQSERDGQISTESD